MLLALDVGNTTITIGLFDGERLRATWRVATEHQRLADEYAVLLLGLLDIEGVATGEIKDAVLASVVPDLAPTFEAITKTVEKAGPFKITEVTWTAACPKCAEKGMKHAGCMSCWEKGT